MKKTFFIVLLSVFIAFFTFADTYYKVEKGDTLFSISRKYQITVAELRAANNLSENDVLKAGQKLKIPSADIATAAALSGSAVTEESKKSEIKTSTYTVQKGDTVYAIAKKNNMTVPELLVLNNLDNSAVIKVGQKLKIKASSQTATKQTTKTTKEPEKETVITSTPDTRNYGTVVYADSSTVWPVKNPTVTQVKGKVSGVQLSAGLNESVTCIREGTVMYVGIYRGFGQVLFVQTQTGIIYAYTGLGSVDVKKGQYVVSGTQLGTAGIDSISGKPGITFMVFQNGQPIDPSKAPRN